MKYRKLLSAGIMALTIALLPGCGASKEPASDAGQQADAGQEIATDSENQQIAGQEEQKADEQQTEESEEQKTSGEQTEGAEVSSDTLVKRDSVAGFPVEYSEYSDKNKYPFVVRTESTVWHLSAADMELIGEEAYYEGLEDVLSLIELDYADARRALDKYLVEEVPPIDIYTDFGNKAAKSATSGAYYNDVSNFIKLFYSWDQAKAALLHEYIHYLTFRYIEVKPGDAVFCEGIAEYFSVFECQNRLAVSVDYSFGEYLDEIKEMGLWNEDGDCIDQEKLYHFLARSYSGPGSIGQQYCAVNNTVITKTEKMQEHIHSKELSYFEAACFVRYLVENYSLDTVMENLDVDSLYMQNVYDETFIEHYEKWKSWNDEKCAELGI